MNNENWWKPGEIRFTAEQVRWLINRLPEISAGDWPSEHRETGYSGKPKKQISRHAYYETPAQIAGELSQRLELCGADGLIVHWVTVSDDQFIKQRLCHYLNISIQELNIKYKIALRYCCGFKRKKTEYSDYFRHQRNRARRTTVKNGGLLTPH